jgi:outer membrane lipoprotein-sorting protein
MRLSLLLVLLAALAMAAQGSRQQPPTADEVVAKMMERDDQRQASLHGYTAIRRYVLENQHHHKRAEMLVKMTCREDGSKYFETVSETGWGGARNHVFPRLLEGETEASVPDAHERSRITPQNYFFEVLGTDTVNERPSYVIAITPKTQNKYLVRGRIWVDAEEYAVVRIEGVPAKNPSFWVKSVHFVHTYQKTGPFWFPASDRSITDVRIFGSTELTIEYFNYAPNTSMLSASSELAATTGNKY